MGTSDQNYSEFLHHLVKSNGLDATLPLWQDGVLGLPSKGAYLHALVDYINQDDFHLPYSRSSKGAHEYLIQKLGLSVLDLHAAHPMLTPYLLAAEGPRAIESAVRNSSPEDVATWLNGNVPTGSSGTNSGLSGVAGFLVFKYDDDLMRAVAQKVPNWATVIDSRGRSTLFYVTHPSRIAALVAAGADASGKDKSGKTLVAWWTSTHPAKLSSELVSEMNRSGATGAPSLQDAIVTKIFHLSLDMLNDDEQEEFARVVSDPDWKWNGTLEGTRREWTLAEIWKFGETAFLAGRIKMASPALNSLVSHYGIDSLRAEPAKLIRLLDGARANLPEKLRKEWFSAPRSPLDNPFLALMDFLTYVPGPSEPYDKNPNYHSTQMLPSEVASQYRGALRRFLAKWSAQEHTRLPEAFTLLNDARWAVPGLISGTLISAIFSPHSQDGKSIPVDRAAWGRVFAGLPVKSPLHTSGMLRNIYNVLERDKSSPEDFPPELVRAIVKIVGTLPESASPQLSRDQGAAQSKVKDLVEAGRLDGQEITSRWLRRFKPEVKSLISQRVLAHKASAVRAKEAPAVSARRM